MAHWERDLQGEIGGEGERHGIGQVWEGCGLKGDKETLRTEPQGHPVLAKQVGQRRQIEVRAGQPLARGITLQPVGVELGDSVEEAPDIPDDHAPEADAEEVGEPPAPTASLSWLQPGVASCEAGFFEACPA